MNVNSLSKKSYLFMRALRYPIAHIRRQSFHKEKLGIYLLDGFWLFSNLEKLGILLHEVGHTDSLDHGHLQCPHTRKKALNCDDSLASEVWAFDILMDEIDLRQSVQKYKELLATASEKTAEIKTLENQNFLFLGSRVPRLGKYCPPSYFVVESRIYVFRYRRIHRKIYSLGFLPSLREVNSC